MAIKQTQPLVTDPMAFIHGAKDTPKEKMTIGARAEEITAASTPVAAPVKKPNGPPAPKNKRAIRKTAKTPAAAKPVQAKPAAKAAVQPMPWEKANQAIRNFRQVRMPEPLDIKLDWIVEKGRAGRWIAPFSIDAFFG